MDRQQSGAITHFKKGSWRDRLSDKSVYVFFGLMVLCGFLGPIVGKVAGLFLGLPGSLIAGFILGIGIVLSANLLDKKCFGAIRTGVRNLEEKIFLGDNKASMEDIEKLVAGYLKLKRLDAADFYSRRLLDYSKAGTTGLVRLNEWVMTTDCYVSRESYLKTMSYNLVWLYESPGVLTLSSGRLSFKGKKITFSCSPENIVSVELGKHPFWQKPIPYHYIKITIDEMGERHVFILNPQFGPVDTVWEGNKQVGVWYDRLLKVKQSMNPTSAFPDWLKDVS